MAAICLSNLISCQPAATPAFLSPEERAFLVSAANSIEALTSNGAGSNATERDISPMAFSRSGTTQSNSARHGVGINTVSPRLPISSIRASTLKAQCSIGFPVAGFGVGGVVGFSAMDRNVLSNATITESVRSHLPSDEDRQADHRANSLRYSANYRRRYESSLVLPAHSR